MAQIGEDLLIGQNLSSSWLPNQYHIRVYEANAATVDVIGQAHRDPEDHGQLPWRDVDWRFADESETVNNGAPFNSSDVKFDHVY